ncbi:MAG TPA: MlaD family protein [Candidatus Dormibacteraeota bacterium]|jgi:phospholipid/cholesterol/gamma-HCH transport system substrate-binding protein|nr:MlaD family protein [Candidatus Dormibacteraeota bacterium]
MPQRKQLTWAELRVGLFVLVGLTVLAAGIFYVTGAGILGPKYRLKTFLPEVSGLANGASVKLDGVEIGNVESVKLVPRVPGKPVDKRRNVEVDMRIDRRFQNDILTDSVASLVTEGLLGNRYVDIERGFTGTPLKENQEIPGAEEKAIKEVVERSAELLGNLTALTDDAQDMVAGVKSGRGTLGKLLTDEQAYNHLNSILAHGDQLVTNVQQGQGTLGKLVASDEMYNKVDKALDNVNGIIVDVREQKGTIGKLLYDPTLYDQAKQAIANTNSLIGDVRAGKGSLGKLATDDTLYNKLRDTSSNLANATAKLNDNTTTAGKLFSDPQLYDNLTSLTGDMRLLIGDFRQNPKKFLRIKVGIF